MILILFLIKINKYVWSFSIEKESDEYKINYISNEINGKNKGLNNIDLFEFILNQQNEEEIQLKYSDISLSSNFKYEKNGIEKIEFLLYLLIII